MSLINLPNELLILVLDFLEAEKDIREFARTNRHLFDFINPYLYKHNIKHDDSSGLWQTLILENDSAGLFFREEAEDLHEYYHPSEPTTSDGLPVPLTEGVQARDAVIRRFLENGTDLEHLDYSGFTALHVAAQERAEPIFWLLIRHGADVHKTTGEYDRRTALHFAAIGGCTRILRFLIREKNLEVNARDWKQQTPLHYAATQGHEAAIRILLEHGAEIDAQDEDGWTPLHRLIAKGRSGSDDWCYPALRALLDLGADVEKRIYEDEATALHVAAVCDRDEKLIEILLNHGADIEARNVDGKTPVYCAVENWSLRMVQVLVEHGADVNTRDNIGYSLLYATIESDVASQTILYLLKKGADMHVDIGNGKTVLQHLKDEDKMWVVEDFLGRGKAGST